MYKKSVSKIVLHLFNGNADEEIKFVEVDGAKFEANEKGEVKVGADGKPVPFVEKKQEEIPEVKKEDFDASKASLEELAKINPAIATFLDEKKKLDQDKLEKEKEDKEKKEENLKEQGEWKTLAESRGSELDKTLELVKQKEEILGKYVGSVEVILKEIMATIPQENLVLIPSNYSPRLKLEYITSNAKLLGAKIMSIKKGDGVDGSDKVPTGTEEEKLVKEINDLVKKGSEKSKMELDLLYEKSQQLKELRIARMKEAKNN